MVAADNSAEVSCDVFSHPELHECTYSVGKSRVTVVCIEHNNPGIQSRVSCTHACKPNFASTLYTAQNKQGGESCAPLWHLIIRWGPAGQLLQVRDQDVAQNCTGNGHHDVEE